MALSQESLTVAGQKLGEWLYDCENLISNVKERPRNKRPRFEIDVTLGGPVAAAINLLFSFLPEGLRTNLAGAVSPQFKGKFIILLSASPVKLICSGEPRQQKVGWDYEVEVELKGELVIAGNSVAIDVGLYFSGEGRREPCQCNDKIKPEDLLSLADYETTPVHAAVAGAVYQFRTHDLASLLGDPRSAEPISAIQAITATSITQATDASGSTLARRLEGIHEELEAILDQNGLADLPRLAALATAEALPSITGVSKTQLQRLSRQARFTLTAEAQGVLLTPAQTTLATEGLKLSVPLDREAIATWLKGSDNDLKEVIKDAALVAPISTKDVRNLLLMLFNVTNR